MKTRIALASDFDDIFMMGYDVWSESQTGPVYLKSCHLSPKYKKGQWWVLEKNKDKRLLSSLIIYDLGNNLWGVGSLATSKELRRKGYASKLLDDVCDELYWSGLKFSG